MGRILEEWEHNIPDAVVWVDRPSPMVPVEPPHDLAEWTAASCARMRAIHTGAARLALEQDIS
jgi:hypothetical protein